MTKSIFRRLFPLLLALSLSASAATTLTGTIHTASGARFNGKVTFFMPFAGARDTTCSPACPIATEPFSYSVTNGNLPATAQITANGDMDPSGTYYRVALVNVYGHLDTQFSVVIPSGSTFDLGSAQQTSIISNNVSLVNPANLAGNNTFTGTNTFSAAAIFGASITIQPTGSLSFQSGSSLNGSIAGNPTFTGNPGFTGIVTFNTGSVNLANAFFTNSPIFSANPIFNTGIANNGTGFKHLRGAVGCTTAASVGATCTSASQTWGGSAFANTSYTLTCNLDTPTGVPVVSTVAKSTSSFTITIAALTAVGATANYECSAEHD